MLYEYSEVSKQVYKEAPTPIMDWLDGYQAFIKDHCHQNWSIKSILKGFHILQQVQFCWCSLLNVFQTILLKWHQSFYSQYKQNNCFGHKKVSPPNSPYHGYMESTLLPCSLKLEGCRGDTMWRYQCLILQIESLTSWCDTHLQSWIMKYDPCTSIW